MAQNATARRLMGDAEGRDCWHLVGGLKGAEGLPCRTGCVRELLASGMDRARHTRVSLAGRQHSLTCVPIDDAVVCSLSSPAPKQPEAWERLTAREREVLRVLSEGKTTSAIAAELGLRTSTVRTHVEHMRAKLGVTTRAALVARGFDLGFLC
jgi:DNA-binding NarL/FixJ family response regulator